ncbi:hypothetical protein KY499_07435 [Arthrobacter sp. PAMC25284]|nr:hypothetical protein [Arthrobacter sp. PAMC25284]QYF91585.1 hypothetical protein KY499_07435 [Arthrobacter sp. PAMC25284]
MERLPGHFSEQQAVLGSHQLGAGVAEELLGGGIEEADGPVLIQQQQRVRAVLQ